MSKSLPSPEEIAKLPPDGGPEFNRLIHATSPYLLQHARNPVDWHEWGDEAFARAKSEDKPIFLSIGYSTCHWCHVMERESFEREDVARILNAHFVPVKVDREERPDLDELYMNATQAFTGRGGWPNSLWLTPVGEPWYAGTYFPREDHAGRLGFKSLLARLSEVWRTRREDVERQRDQIVAAMKSLSESGAPADALGRDAVARAIEDLRRAYDPAHGGFGGAPKFPPHQSLRLLAREHRRTGGKELLEMLAGTLDGMALGGIRDHVGGGFHRYSTDERWFLPHFEKMLYDNALLLGAYADGFRLTGERRYARVAEEIADWALRVMRDERGGFYSALDADSEGVEGKFYVWKRSEILDVLGQEDGELFCRVYGIQKGGNFRDEATGRKTGENIPFLSEPVPDTARALGMDAAALDARLGEIRRKLREHRDQRVWPHLDDKVLAAWNGLMIDGLACAGQCLERSEYVEAASSAADFVLGAMRRDGRLLRSWRAGAAALPGYSDDYAFVADGLLTLHESGGGAHRLGQAGELLDVLIEHHRDEEGGGFFFTASDHEALLTRSKSPLDRALPSGNGVAARALIRYGLATGQERYVRLGGETVRAFGGLIEQAPRAVESLVLAAALWLDTGEAAPTEAVRVWAVPVSETARAGEQARVKVVVDLAEGWHANSNKPLQRGLVPTTVELSGGPFALESADYPAGERATLPFNPEPLSLYRGRVEIPVSLRLREGTPPGRHEATLRVRLQPCDESSCQEARELDAAVVVQTRE